MSEHEGKLYFTGGCGSRMPRSGWWCVRVAMVILLGMEGLHFTLLHVYMGFSYVPLDSN